MPRRRVVCVSPPCSSSDEDQPDRPCSSSDEYQACDEEERLANSVSVIQAFEATITSASVWRFASNEAAVYRRSGLYEANRRLGTEVIDFYVETVIERMMEERIELGWGPASPAAYRELKADDQHAFDYLMSSLNTVPWLFLLRAWDCALQCPQPRNLRADPFPDHEVTVAGIAREIIEVQRSQIRNSVYVPRYEPDWE